jgi:hypothetical protein
MLGFLLICFYFSCYSRSIPLTLCDKYVFASRIICVTNKNNNLFHTSLQLLFSELVLMLKISVDIYKHMEGIAIPVFFSVDWDFLANERVNENLSTAWIISPSTLLSIFEILKNLKTTLRLQEGYTLFSGHMTFVKPNVHSSAS